MNDSGDLGISKTIHTETLLNIELDNDMLRSNMMYYYTSRLEEKGFKIFYMKEESNVISKKQKRQNILPRKKLKILFLIF